MTRENRGRPHTIRFALLSGVSSLLLISSAFGADQPAPSNAEVEEIVVTGSSIPTAPDKVTVPVVILDSEQVEKNGVSSNILEVLRKALPQFSGRSNAGASNASNANQNTAGGSQIQLHNLDTLVLINGRRVATNGISALGGKNFVDINQIPTAAIDHFEVLTDGASAIYGSDAIGGVVNIILKSNYDGAEIGTRYGGASGDYNETSDYFVAGKSTDDYSITASGSYTKTDPLFLSDRAFTSPRYNILQNLPGAINSNKSILAPGLQTPGDRNPTGIAAVAPSQAALLANGTYFSPAGGAGSVYDISKELTLLLRQEQKAFASTYSADIIDKKLVFFGDFEFSQTRSFAQFAPNTTTVTAPQNSPFNPVAGAFTGITFGDLNKPRQFYNSAQSVRVTGGLRGDLGDGWNWETGFVHSHNDLEQRQANVLYGPNIAPAIAGGYNASGVATPGGAFSKVYGGYSTAGGLSVLQPALNPFAIGGVNNASYANIYGIETLNASAQIDSFDAKLVGTLFQLPAGKPAFALGGSVRQESLDGSPDANGTRTTPTDPGSWIGGQIASRFAKSRLIDAAFGELRLPVTSDDWNLPGIRSLDLVTAVRGEHYSDAGYSLVPKYALRWQPIDSQVTFRASYAKSFTAPTLYQEFSPFFTQAAAASSLVAGAVGLNSTVGIGTVNQGGIGNASLKPSKTGTTSFGVVVRPDFIPGLTVTGDYNHVVLTGFPGGAGVTANLQSVNQFGAASPFVGNVTMGTLPGGATFTAPGQLASYLASGGNVFLVDPPRNLGGERLRAYTLGIEYVLETEKLGAFTFDTQGSILGSAKYQVLAGQPYFQYAGKVSNAVFGGSLPHYHFYSSVDWAYQNWDIQLANTYLSSMTDVGAASATTVSPFAMAHVSSYMSWDLRLGLSGDAIPDFGAGAVTSHITGWKLAIGINNLTDAMPPISPLTFKADATGDVSTYSPIGRLVYVTASVKF